MLTLLANSAGQHLIKKEMLLQSEMGPEQVGFS